MKIERAVREKTFTLTSIAGPSGSGKTYSALLYARGLVGPDGKIGFVDTENKRSRFYADVAGGFDVIDLDPPFTSHRYIEAIKAFEQAGYGAIVIDSISHEWEGTGGVLEQADAIEQATKRAGLHCWAKPKGGHKKLMNELLQTRAHLILCCRVKEKVVQVKGADGKTEIVNEGFVVVQEKMFIYEMTVSMMLAESTHLPTILKCPGDLMHAFPDGKLITADVGAAIRQWSDQGVAVDPEMDAKRREGLLAANDGTEALKLWWGALGTWQKRLEGMKETFKSIAAAADQLKADMADAGASPADRLAHAKASAGSGEVRGEGFDLDHVNGELNKTESSDASPSSPASDEGGGASIPVEGSAPDQSASGGPAAPGGTATPSETPGADALSPEDEKKWLVTLAAVAVASMTDGEKAVVEQTKTMFRDGLSDDVRKRARSIIKHAGSGARGEAEHADIIEVIAGVARCEAKEIKP